MVCWLESVQRSIVFTSIPHGCCNWLGYLGEITISGWGIHQFHPCLTHEGSPTVKTCQEKSSPGFICCCVCLGSKSSRSRLLCESKSIPIFRVWKLGFYFTTSLVNTQCKTNTRFYIIVFPIIICIRIKTSNEYWLYGQRDLHSIIVDNNR